jgi:membrane protease YdiL (CAAX protease family)
VHLNPLKRAYVGSPPVRWSWSLNDFILVWLGGFLGASVFFGVGLLFADSDWIVVLGLAGQYLGNLGVLWFVRQRKEDDDLRFDVEPRDLGFIGLGLLLQLIIALLFLPLDDLLFPDGRPPQEVAETIGSADTSSLLKIALVVTAVVVAPIVEELLFRGVLLRALEKRSARVAIIVSGAIFSAVHILGLDTERIVTSAALVLPPIFILGILLAWLTLRTGRLGPAIFLHSGWNLLAAIVLLAPSDLL